MYEVL